MEYPTISRVRIRFVYSFVIGLILTHNCVLGHDGTIEKRNTKDDLSQIKWFFNEKNVTSSNRVRRSPAGIVPLEPHNFIEDPKCRDDVKRLCGAMDNSNDDLFMLECVQTFKVFTIIVVINLFDFC